MKVDPSVSRTGIYSQPHSAQARGLVIHTMNVIKLTVQHQ